MFHTFLWHGQTASHPVDLLHFIYPLLAEGHWVVSTYWLFWIMGTSVYSFVWQGFISLGYTPRSGILGHVVETSSYCMRRRTQHMGDGWRMRGVEAHTWCCKHLPLLMVKQDQRDGMVWLHS